MYPPVVLCVDDQPQLLQIRKANLELLGYSVVTATSAPSAIATLENMTVATVLLEYKLEGMDAEAIAFHIKQRFPDMPIILLSAYSDMPESVLWLVDEYVMRSQPPERLSEVIERMTGSARKPSAYSDKGLKRKAAG